MRTVDTNIIYRFYHFIFPISLYSCFVRDVIRPRRITNERLFCVSGRKYKCPNSRSTIESAVSREQNVKHRGADQCFLRPEHIGTYQRHLDLRTIYHVISHQGTNYKRKDKDKKFDFPEHTSESVTATEEAQMGLCMKRSSIKGLDGL